MAYCVTFDSTSFLSSEERLPIAALQERSEIAEKIAAIGPIHRVYDPSKNDLAELRESLRNAVLPYDPQEEIDDENNKSSWEKAWDGFCFFLLLFVEVIFCIPYTLIFGGP